MKDIYESYPILFFENAALWEAWLEDNAEKSAGVRLKFAKKNTGIPTMTYDEALEAALCFGWIDSRKNAYDAHHWLQAFSPRKPKSVWSQINRGKIERLSALGKMRPSGMQAVEAAQHNGQWERAYASQSTIPIPDDFQAVLADNPAALAFFLSMDSANRYAFLYRLHMTKNPDARRKKIGQYMEMLARKERFHP